MHARPNADERRDEAENRGASEQCLAGAALRAGGGGLRAMAWRRSHLWAIGARVSGSASPLRTLCAGHSRSAYDA